METLQRGSIPEELLRPRRDEAPRYPVDMIIGPLGQGSAPVEAYDTAKRAAEALLAGSMSAPILSTVNRVFLEGCLSALNGINPRLFRLGGGREEPDGSVSFLVRFAGREEGITGELYVRLEERRSAASPSRSEPVPEQAEEGGDPEPPETSSQPQTIEAAAEEGEQAETGEEAAAAPEEQPVPVNVPAERIWVFEDLILEEARSREEENKESRHRFDFSPYERFF